MKLELVQVLFRHGSRSASQEEARHIGITDESLYPQGFYQLTNEGKNEVYALGRALREKYDEFLGNYNFRRVHACSSNSERTKESLQLVLAGLYPPTESERWNENLNWNPIAFSHGARSDALLLPFITPYYKNESKKELASSEEYQNQIAQYAKFLSFMREKTGINFEDNLVFHTGWTFYAITINRALNLPVPTWCTDEVLQNLSKLGMICVHAMSLTQKLKRINGGVMVRQILENIKINNSAEKPKRIYLYSAHDLTLAALMKAQNMHLSHIPATGSAVVVEKYRDDQNCEYVRALFWDGQEFNVNKLGDCDEFCPIEEYIEMTKDVIPSDEELTLLGQEKSG